MKNSLWLAVFLTFSSCGDWQPIRAAVTDACCLPPSLGLISEGRELWGSQMGAGPGPATSCQKWDGSAAPMGAEWHLLHGEGGGDPLEGQKQYGEQTPPQPGWQRPHQVHWVYWWGGGGCEGERIIWLRCLDFPRRYCLLWFMYHLHKRLNEHLVTAVQAVQFHWVSGSIDPGL